MKKRCPQCGSFRSVRSAARQLRVCGHARFDAGGVMSASVLSLPPVRDLRRKSWPQASSCVPLICTLIGKPPTEPWAVSCMSVPTASFSGSMPWEKTRKPSSRWPRSSNPRGVATSCSMGKSSSLKVSTTAELKLNVVEETKQGFFGWSWGANRFHPRLLSSRLNKN